MAQLGLHQVTPTEFVDAGGVRFSFRRFGKADATPLIFFQHFAGTMDNWDPVLTNRLAEICSVVQFDNAGIGRSTGATPTSIAGMARDAIAFTRALGDAQVNLFGFSTGGFVAQEIATQAPYLVNRIILAGTGPQGGENMTQYSPRVMEIINRPNATFEERCLALFFADTETSQTAGRAWLDRVASRKTDREPAVSEAASTSQLQAIQAWGRIGGDRRARLEKIRQPVLVANGNEDIMVPTVNSFILQQELPNAQLIIYPDSGHGALFQYSNVFVEEVVRFLAPALLATRATREMVFA